MRGEQCEHLTAEWRRCRGRAYALVEFTPPDWRTKVQRWLCGAHQARWRKQGVGLKLVRKWRAEDAPCRECGAEDRERSACPGCRAIICQLCGEGEGAFCCQESE